MTDDERSICNLVETWMTASKAGDLATILSLMADDVVCMISGQKPFGKFGSSMIGRTFGITWRWR